MLKAIYNLSLFDFFQDWQNIQALLGKTGREGLKRRIGQCNVLTIALSTAKRARDIMGVVDLEAIRDVSAGAATFFVWVSENRTIMYLKVVLFVWKKMVCSELLPKRGVVVETLSFFWIRFGGRLCSPSNVAVCYGVDQRLLKKVLPKRVWCERPSQPQALHKKFLNVKQ